MRGSSIVSFMANRCRHDWTSKSCTFNDSRGPALLPFFPRETIERGRRLEGTREDERDREKKRRIAKETANNSLQGKMHGQGKGGSVVNCTVIEATEPSGNEARYAAVPRPWTGPRRWNYPENRSIESWGTKVEAEENYFLVPQDLFRELLIWARLLQINFAFQSRWLSCELAAGYYGSLGFYRKIRRQVVLVVILSVIFLWKLYESILGTFVMLMSTIVTKWN